MPVAFADGSARNDFLGIGVQWGGALQWLAVSRTISSPKTLDSHAAELVAIDCAVSQLLYSVQRGGTGPPITIFSDSLGALQALRNPCPKSGQFLVTQITLKVYQINISNRTNVALEWSPGHSHIPGNEMAQNLAQHATKKEAKVSLSASYPTLQSVVLERGRKMFLPPPSPWTKPQLGRFTHNLDKALPGKHTLELYNGKSHVEAATLCQLRSGMCKLNKYLARIGVIDTDTCSCGRERESVDHFLFRCPLWSDQRQNICRVASKFNRWGDLSFALGGWSGDTKDGDRTKWRPSLEMVAATVKFALETQRLAEVQREKAGMRDANINTSSEETVDSDNADDDPTA